MLQFHITYGLRNRPQASNLSALPKHKTLTTEGKGGPSRRLSGSAPAIVFLVLTEQCRCLKL